MKLLLVILLAGSTLLGCQTVSNTAPQKSYVPIKQYDPGVIGTNVLGITVGMTPRRVYEEYIKNHWSLSPLSGMTLEDMIEEKFQDGNFYISTKVPIEGELEVHFRRGRTIFVRHTYFIEEKEYINHVSQAKRHLNSLGETTEKIDGKSFKITYAPYKTGYVYYDIHKLVSTQRGYRVWFAVANW